MFLFVVSEILGVFVKTLTADDRHFPLNWENLQQPLQMQLSKKQKTFSQFFVPFLKSTKRWSSWFIYFPNNRLRKTGLDKCLKSLVSGHPLTVNMSKSRKQCWSLLNSTFIVLFHSSKGNWYEKSWSKWYLKF